MSLSRIAAAMALLAGARAVAAQATHLVVVTGLGGEPAYTQRFREAGAALVQAAITEWGVAADGVVWLAEDRSDPRTTGIARRETVQEALLGLSRRVAPGDVVVLVLIGHGSGEGAGSRVNVAGPDPTAADYAAWLAGFARQRVAVVVAASASGDFVGALAGPDRVVVTATRTALERNESVFATPFAHGLATKAADADKDGRVTLLEAFTYARAEVERAYAAERKLLTEHAVVSDTALAATIVFGGGAATADPRVAALVAERRALEQQVAALRARKAQMDSVAYEAELERLALAIAERTARLRALGSAP